MPITDSLLGPRREVTLFPNEMKQFACKCRHFIFFCSSYSLRIRSVTVTELSLHVSAPITKLSLGWDWNLGWSEFNRRQSQTVKLSVWRMWGYHWSSHREKCSPQAGALNASSLVGLQYLGPLNMTHPVCVFVCFCRAEGLKLRVQTGFKQPPQTDLRTSQPNPQHTVHYHSHYGYNPE